MNQKILFLLLIVFAGYSCSVFDSQSYTKEATSKTRTEVDMSPSETVEEWEARVVTYFHANNLNLEEIWIEVDEDYTSFCGCFECRMGGTKMGIISSADPELLEGMGFQD